MRPRASYVLAVVFCAGWLTGISARAAANPRPEIRKDLFQLLVPDPEGTENIPFQVPYVIQKVLLHPLHRAILLNTRTHAVYYVKVGDPVGEWRISFIDAKGVQLQKEELVVQLEWSSDLGN